MKCTVESDHIISTLRADITQNATKHYKHTSDLKSTFSSVCKGQVSYACVLWMAR